MLTETQKKRLQYLHSYEWAEGNEEENLKALLAKIDSHEELWFASFIIMWSPEEGDLKFFYTHSLCDRGLAMFLYWALGPMELYKAQNENKMDELQKSYFKVLKEIEGLLLSDHYSNGKIAFDPFKESWRKKEKGLELVPEELVNATEREMELSLNYNEVFN